MSTRMGASGGPALLPSKARNSMPVLEPVTRSSNGASGAAVRRRLATADALLVEVEQAGLAGVVGLECRVGGTVVELPELLAVVVRGRVQRLAAAEVLDHVLDPPVARAGRLARDDRDGGPEAEVHVGRLRVERIQVPRRACVALAQRTQPHR